MREDLFRKAAIKPLRFSDYLLILGSESYANALVDPYDSEHMILMSQVLAAKDAGKPVIILWIKGIKATMKNMLKEALKGMRIVGKYECLSDPPMDADVKAIIKIMKENPR